MLKHADPILKVSLAVAALLAGSGVGYYYGIYLPAQDVRRQAQEMAARQEERKAQAAALAKRAEREQAAQNEYQMCLGQAESVYQDRWSQTCQSMRDADIAAFNDCADNFFSTEQGCLAKHPITPPRNCALPAQSAQLLTQDREAHQAQCLTRLQSQQKEPR